jgi:TetR/AcrR family transcriptional regulator, transcriptional repressor for nem operon
MVDPAGQSRAPSTQKGRATRERIVAAAADLMYRNGVVGTSTPAVRDAASVSSSQIYHYFADKDDLTQAVIAFQTETIMAAQAELLADVDSVEKLRRWRDFIVASARGQDGFGGCPLGSLSSELSDRSPWARQALAAGFEQWQAAISASLTSMIDNGTLTTDTNADELALAVLAAVQGGLLLAQAQRNTDALEAALDTLIASMAFRTTA